MNNPLAFDLIVGLAFSAAIISGILFGFSKLILLLLALSTPLLIELAVSLALGGDKIAALAHESPELGYASMGAISGILAVLVIVFVPGPRSAAGHVFGLLFAVSLATLAVASGSLVASQRHPESRESIRAKSLTGPAALALGDALVSYLPDNPLGILKRDRPKL